MVDVLALNSSSSTGAGLTGLAYNTSGLTAYYHRNTASASVAISLATATLGTFTSGGLVVVDGTNMPGLYQLGIPNAALASGADSVVIYLQGATNLAPIVLEIELTAVNNQSTGFGLVNASANVVQIAGTASAGAAGYVGVDWGQIANKTTTNALTGTTISTSQAVASVSGSVASVTGAVGSVTGNIGGNVAGSVGSVTGNVGGSVASVTAAVTVSTSQLLGTPRSLNSIADGSITLNDALWCAVAVAAGKEQVSGTTYTVQTPSTGTTIRTFTLDSGTSPTQRT